MKKSNKLILIIISTLLIVSTLAISISANDYPSVYFFPDGTTNYDPTTRIGQSITRYVSNYSQCSITFLVWENYQIYPDGTVSGDLRSIGWSASSDRYDTYMNKDTFSIPLAYNLDTTIRQKFTNQDVLNFELFSANTNVNYNKDPLYKLTGRYGFIEGKEVTLTNFNNGTYYVTAYVGGDGYSPYYYILNTPYVSSTPSTPSDPEYDGSAFEYIISQAKMLLEPLYQLVDETVVNVIVFLVLASIIYFVLIRNLFRLCGSTKCVHVADIIFIALCIGTIVTTLGVNLIGVISNV